MFGGVWDWNRFWMLTGLLSMALAFMNILPIPALDGGHAIFLLYEMVSGKPASEKVLEKAQQVGMIILLALMAYTFGNDIFKAFF
jgi:regulator of sigma E protease